MVQAVFEGLTTGLLYALFATGFVIIYRVTGVLNLAHGEIGAFGAALLALLCGGYGVPYWFALPVAISAGAAAGAIIELVVVRRLLRAPKVVLVVATMGIAQLLELARVSLPNTAAGSSFPVPFSTSWHPFPSLVILSRNSTVLILVPVALGLLAIGLGRTNLGLMIRASASNSDTARVLGVRVKQASVVAWATGGALAALTVILIAPLQDITPGSLVHGDAQILSADLLLRALVVTVIARDHSLKWVLAAGIAIGSLEGAVAAHISSTGQGVIDVYLLIGVLIAVAVSPGRTSLRRAAGLDESGAIGERQRRAPTGVGPAGFVLLFCALALVPVAASKPSQLFLWTDVVLFAAAALPIALLVDWAGMLSLGQFAFVGVGAVTLAELTAGVRVRLPLVAGPISLHLPWGGALAISGCVGTVVALALAWLAARARRLMIAVVTLAFAVAAQQWLLPRAAKTAENPSGATPVVNLPTLGPLGPARRSYFYLCLVALIVMTAFLAHLRRTGIGRSIRAIKGNESTAASMTVSPAHARLVAFGIAGGLGAITGGLLVTARSQVDPSTTFTLNASLLLVAAAVIGGVSSLAGPILGALVVVGIPTVFGNGEHVKLLTSGVGLLILLMYLPGGLVQLIDLLREALLAPWRRPAPAKRPETAGRLPPAAPTGLGPDDDVWLSVDHIDVTFGGNTAVKDVSLSVRRQEIVCLLGTNGAGKSTLLDAIGGFVRAQGAITLLGEDVSRVAPYQRHRLGMARMFQASPLLPGLTARETILLSLEAREPSRLFASMTGLPSSRASERRKARMTDEIADFLRIGPYLDRPLVGLSTGTRRVVELAWLLAAGARVLLLDEPSAGLAQAEVEVMPDLLSSVRRELGAAILLVEHNVTVITDLSDRAYYLDRGQLVCEGPTDVVLRDPRVAASYSGTTNPTPPPA